MGRSQGRGNAGAVVATMVLLVALEYVSGATFTVGDKRGWDTGVSYDAWAKKNTFAIGDSLVFNYGALHSVVEVSKSDYTSCSLSNPIATYSTGSDTITITKPTQYFICGTFGHCSGGMALQINAASAPAPVVAPVVAPPPSKPVEEPSAPVVPSAEAPVVKPPSGVPAEAVPPSLEVPSGLPPPPATLETPPAPGTSSDTKNSAFISGGASSVLVAIASACAVLVLV